MVRIRRYGPLVGESGQPEGSDIVKLPAEIPVTDIVATPAESEPGASIVATPAKWKPGAAPIKPHEQKRLRKREAGSVSVKFKGQPPEKKP